MRKLILTLLYSLVSLLSYSHSQEIKLNSKSLDDFNKKLSSFYYLNELDILLLESKYLIANWVFIEKQPNTTKKVRLKNIHEELLPKRLNQINYLSSFWSFTEKLLYLEIKDDIEKFKNNQQYIMRHLNSFEAYDDLMVLFEVTPMAEEGSEMNEIFRGINSKLEVLKQNFYNQYNNYLPSLPISEDVPKEVLDHKMVLIKLFVAKFNLKDLVNDKSDYKYIYEIYSLKELKDALANPIEDESEFYKKYNKMILKLNQK